MLRDIFQARLEKGLLGTGSDSWGIEDNEEVISDTPLSRYYTGILFPEMVVSFDDEPNTMNNNLDEEEQENNDNERGEKAEAINRTDDVADKEEDLKAINRFYPNTMGLTFCVPESIKTIEVEFSFGLYHQATRKELKIKVDNDFYETLLNDNDFPLKRLLHCENGFLSLLKDLDGNKGGRSKERSGDYKAFDEYKKQHKEINLEPIEKLLTSAWKRELIKEIKTISLNSIKEPEQITLRQISEKNKEFLNIGYYVTCYVVNRIQYIRIQLANLSTKHPKNKFSNRNETLNKKCLFQTQIKVISTDFLPYHKPKASEYDEEEKLLDFLYRDVKSYAIGHNCATMWNEQVTEMWTSYIPHYDSKAIKNEFSKSDFNENDFSILNESLLIHHLSIWGKSQNELIILLQNFLTIYQQWIEQQKNSPDANHECAKKILINLDKNLARLSDNINLLNNATVFKAFQYANTAMLLQIAVNNNETLHQKLAKLDNQKSPFQSISEYKYRPFQLAFLLLSLGDMVNPESKTRKNTVDLIWFPTGGGKTEAYLAVTAFTLCYRRLKYSDNYQGVSVIMRYTLRLLTAQQFERASRLITALEILRQNFSQDLKTEAFTIGLWIGMASTPNTIVDAKKAIEAIEKECNKKGNPRKENKFQIESCTWCGENLIQLKNEQWHYNFEVVRNNFKIRCINSTCHFNKNDLPVQVVDESLYKNSPSLLFATVDKFAMLSWKEHGHKLFNSLTNGLPPDLIIQDELHLLSGPLGSLVGLFESVIELLSTKNDISPKIIASTATTRNTAQQIKELYGHSRQVNIFPPSGLSYKDSFFAKEDNTSKRRYFGIMPTGKTTVDTQLRLLAHLLVARLECYLSLNEQEKVKEINPYWTIVSYYNTLRDVGRLCNKVGDEIVQMTKQLQNRLQLVEHRFNYSGLTNRTKELTSRIDSSEIKPTLSALEKTFSMNDEGYVNYDIVDLILATNMLSVGIDISRLNIMQINGMPRNIAEYIQASSRVARQNKGLVITTLDANRAREKSHFEHFVPFHQNIYRKVEPLSVTSFTENTVDILLASLLVTFIRHKIGHNKNSDVIKFVIEDTKELVDFIENRFSENSEMLNFFKKRIEFIANDWLDRIQGETGCKKYEELLKKPDEISNLDKDSKIWVVLQSLRDIDSNTSIRIWEKYINNTI